MNYRTTIGAVLFGFALYATPATAQVVELPSLSIQGSRIDSAVTFDSQRAVYLYNYTLVAAATNQAPITGFSVDIAGRIPRPQIDPQLNSNIARSQRQEQPNTTIPVGVIVPDPSIRMLAGPNMGAGVSFGYWSKSSAVIQPGETRTGFRLESKFPPAWREAVIWPSKVSWNAIEAATAGPGVEYSWRDYDLKVEVLAPFDLDESKLFAGGGQSPREVNAFLQYASPSASRSEVPSGTQSCNLTIRFGPTVNPATFAATLDGQDVTSLFRPMAGVVDFVTIPLAPGTTKLQLSVEGSTTSGRTARDTDTLTFIVK